MKKFLILLFFCLVISGCDTNSGKLTYQNPELGITFEYSEKFGLPDEHLDEKNILTNISFNDPKSGSNIEITPVEKEYIVPSCRDIPEDSINQNCQMMTVDGHSFLIYKAIGDFDEAQGIQLQTKEGIWRLITGNPDLYDEMIEITKTIKYLK